MKKLLCTFMFILSAFSISHAESFPPILNTYRVGQGFNVHYDGSLLIYEDRIDGKYNEDTVLLYQSDLNSEYKIIRWRDYKEHGNISATLECVSGSRIIVRFKYLHTEYRSYNRTYYWDIPLEYTAKDGSVKLVYLAIRTEQSKDFGSGCSAGFLPYALLLLVPIILIRRVFWHQISNTVE